MARAKPCLSARLTAAQCQRLIIKQRWRRQAAEATTAIQASRRLHATGRAQHESICDHFMFLVRVEEALSPEALAPCTNITTETEEAPRDHHRQ